ncbi:protein ITPRID2-like [Physella acuta]|uniref:protein ITPRID2-like n=1 Tax=Physella acuta TaxID=109671 RepID=UPI0027DCE73E|nr:protein ITPRID2-like [Physella acuta]
MEEKERKSSTECEAENKLGGLIGVARILGTKAKGQGAAEAGLKKKLKAQDDDLPLGSEANSLSCIKNAEPSHTDHNKVSWQSFSSDLSNHTSASSASLDMLLNERQMDPEEMLLHLGFGMESPALGPSLARVPERFLQHPTRAAGIILPGYLEQATELEDVPPAPAVEAAPAPAAKTRPVAEQYNPKVEQYVSIVRLPLIDEHGDKTGSAPHIETTSKSNETTSKSNETTSKSNGTTSKSNETTSKSNETTSKSNETTSKSNETTSKSNGTTSKSNETTSKSNETTSKSNETTSKSNETTSKSNGKERFATWEKFSLFIASSVRDVRERGASFLKNK